ncbi:MAG: XRE family transcriptional regulator [Coriobacteriia bacterium]|nr:XRE family transcriptional regulator [Coriobacteriia bacterium]
MESHEEEEVLTEELLNELLFSSSAGHYIDTHQMTEPSLSSYLNELLRSKDLKKSEVIKKSRLNETFAYQIFSGDRHASRNKVLQLAFAMELSLREAQRLLKHAGANELYCKDRRDAIIIYCLSRKCSLIKVDAELYKFGEETITEV